MKIAIGADHRGYVLKHMLIAHNTINKHHIVWIDMGTHSEERTDYPLFVPPVCNAVLSGQADRGILLCGSGVGMAIVANRYGGIYAALVWNREVAIQSRHDDNSNVLVLPADYVTEHQVMDMVSAWLDTKFAGGHYQERLALFD